MALIKPSYFDCVVAIGIKRSDDICWIGTGFLFGRKSKKEENIYHIFLVTNRHVLKEKKEVYLRFNPKDGKKSHDYPLNLRKADDSQVAFFHPDSSVDIAICPINPKFLDDRGMNYDFFADDVETFSVSDLIVKGTTEGDPVFVLGYPMGIVGENRKYTILRSGAIARIRDLLEGHRSDFIIDALVFPGNSGGPVVIKPETTFLPETKFNNESRLIGVVKAYIPYQDKAVSLQTGRVRVIFEDNSGLTLIEPVDRIIETIDLYNKDNGIQ